MDWQGHRGARGLYPENTIGSMEEALKYPVTTLEFDVVVSKDMKVVLSHEPWLSGEICLDLKGQSLEDKKNNLFKMTYDEIKNYDCGSKPHPRFPLQKKVVVGKPTLDKVLEVLEPLLKKLNRSDLEYNIEIKSTPEDEISGFQPQISIFADLVIKTLQSRLPNERFTIQSFDWRVLKYIKANYPEVRLVALLEENKTPQEVLQELGFTPSVFSPNFKLVTGPLVDFFHSKGIKVIPWTVNEVEDMEKMIKLKVDGIITDYPNRISLVNEKHCKKREHLFEGRCVKVPAHAEISNKVPGWSCKRGYVQKRMSCQKMVLPRNAVLNEDGKTWKCPEGLHRYRGTCKH